MSTFAGQQQTGIGLFRVFYFFNKNNLSFCFIIQTTSP